MSTQFKPIQIPPGVVAMPTKNMASTNWAGVNLMRWIEGELQPVGGQAQYQFYGADGATPSPGFASRCKAIHGWYDLQDIYHIAYICEQNVYVYTGQTATSGTLVEITPLDGWAAPQLPTQGGYGELDYSDDNYGTPRTSSENLPIDQIPNIWSVDNFGAILLVMNAADGRLLFWNPASGPPGTAVGVGATAAWVAGATTITIAANPGNVVPGMNVFNNTQDRQVGVVLSITTTTLTLTGPALSAGASGNTLYFGNTLGPVISSQAAPYNLVPLGRSFVVTAQRFVIMFGTTDDGTVGGGSFRRFAWCDQADYTNWNYASVTAQCGFLDIEPASPIITAISGRFGTLMFTAKKAYIIQFLGLPYVYNYVELADNCTPFSPLSITTTSSYVLWMSEQGMFSFDGTNIAPVACLVRPWVTDDIDPINARVQSFAYHESAFNEFWWFYPQSPATNALGNGWNTRAVYYNYKEGWWGQAQMSRSAGITSSYTVQSVLADGLIAFQHEVGNTYVNAALPWAETFDLNVASGTRLTTLKQVLPDIKGNASNLQFSFWSQRTRNSMGVMGSWSPPVNIRPDGYVDARVTGRDIRMKITMTGSLVYPFTVGQHLVDAVPRGDR